MVTTDSKHNLPIAPNLLQHNFTASAPNQVRTIAMVRMRSDARTRQYIARRTSEGLPKREIHRCLKRYIVRELYPLNLADLDGSASSA